MDSLETKLRDTLDWMWLRERLVQNLQGRSHPVILAELNRLWPEGRVPRQLEVVKLEQKISTLENERVDLGWPYWY